MATSEDDGRHGCRAWFECLQLGLAVVSVAGCVLTGLAYGLRPVAAVGVTVFPVWAWAAVAVVPVLVSYSRSAWRRTVALLVVWAVLALVFSEEPRALVTGSHDWPTEEWLATRDAGTGLRIVTVNCAGGDERVAEEGLAYEPDILLLQESPGRQGLQDLLAGWEGYKLVYGLDASIIARGGAMEAPVERDHRGFIAVAGMHIGGREFRVVNTRFLLPYHQPDIWRPGAWRDAREAYAVRDEQMRAVAAYADKAPDGMPLIVGGDFNTPAGDRLFRRLRPRLRDSFREAGIGLGSTIVNDAPISRIDQVWISDELRVHAVVARVTVHSDHRLVVCDVEVR